MKQKNTNRENFWDVDVMQTEEMENYLSLTEEKKEAILSLGDAFFTLFCC